MPDGTATLRVGDPRRSDPPAVRARPGGPVVDAAAALAGLGLGAVVALAITGETHGSLAVPGGKLIFAGRVAGLAGSYLMMVMLLLVARIPLIERAAGQDRLVRWHRLLGQWPIYLLTFHAVFVTVGYAEEANIGPWRQLHVLVGSYPDVLAALVAYGLLVVAGVTSIRAARRRVRYETWWAIHLYLYLALALSFSHQLANGEAFIGHPLTRLVWGAAWAAVTATVVAFRLVLPVVRSLRHGLHVVSVTDEAPGVVSVVVAGRHLDRLAVAGGQYFHWRFLARGLWWQAHPYSVSAVPRPPYMRLTAKVCGDHSAAVSRLPAGTRVWVEGPYGRFTASARANDKVLLVGAGVGVTPIRSLLEDLPDGVEPVVLTRASKAEHLIFRKELASLVDAKGGRMVEVLGPRKRNRLDARHLAALVPDIAERDVFVCGPVGVIHTVTAAAASLGVPDHSIHSEEFSF